MIYTTLEQAQQALGNNTPNVQGLEPVQIAQYRALEAQVEQFGKYDWGIGPSGSHYTPADNNPFVTEGLICANCAFYEQGACEVVQGVIDPLAICKFWIIPADKLGV